MAWVLIVLLTASGSNGGNAMTTAPFVTRDACESAGRATVSMSKDADSWMRSGTVSYRCVPAA